MRGVDIKLLRLGDGPDGGAFVELSARFECEDLEMTGVALATVKRDGTLG